MAGDVGFKNQTVSVRVRLRAPNLICACGQMAKSLGLDPRVWRFDSSQAHQFLCGCGEMVAALDLGSGGRKSVEVRILSPVPICDRGEMVDTLS